MEGVVCCPSCDLYCRGSLKGGVFGGNKEALLKVTSLFYIRKALLACARKQWTLGESIYPAGEGGLTFSPRHSGV